MRKVLLTLLAIMMIATTSTAWAVTDSKIVFTTIVEQGALSSDATFTDGDLTLNFPGGNEKFSIDQPTNVTRFGDASSYDSYAMRLKPGAKSDGTANYMHLSLSEYTTGVLRLAVRSANSSEARRLIVKDQWGDVIYNDYISDTQALKVMEGETEVSVYPYVDIPFYSSELTIYYPDNSLNFYSIEVLPFRTCAEANVEALTPNKVFPLYEFFVVYSKEGYTYISDGDGHCTLLYGMTETFDQRYYYPGMMVRTSPYNGLPELRQITPVSKLNGDSYWWSNAYTEFEPKVPSQDNLNQYTVYRGVTFSEAASFSSASKTTIVGTWRGQQINFFNALRIDADLDPTKSYDIVAFPSVFKGTYQAYPAEITEHINYDPTNLQVFTATDGKVSFTWETEVQSECYVLTINFENGDNRSIRVWNNLYECYADYAGQWVTWSVQAQDRSYDPVSDKVNYESPFVWPEHHFSISNLKADVAADGTCTFSWEGSTPDDWRVRIYKVEDGDYNQILGRYVRENTYTYLLPQSGKYAVYVEGEDIHGNVLCSSEFLTFDAIVPTLGEVTVTVDNRSSISTDNGLYLWWWTPGQDGHLVPLLATPDGQYVATINPGTSNYGVLVVNQNVVELGWSGSTQTNDRENLTSDAYLVLYDHSEGYSSYWLFDPDYMPTNLRATVGEDDIVEISWDAVKDAAFYWVYLGHDQDIFYSYRSDENSFRLIEQYNTEEVPYTYYVQAYNEGYYPLSPRVMGESEIVVPGRTHYIGSVRASVSEGVCTVTWDGDVNDYQVEFLTTREELIYSTIVKGAKSCSYTIETGGQYYCIIYGLNAEGKAVRKAYSDIFFVNSSDGGPDYTPTNLSAMTDDITITLSWDAQVHAAEYKVWVYRESDNYCIRSCTLGETSLTFTSTLDENTSAYWTIVACDRYDNPLSEVVTGEVFTIPVDNRYIDNLQAVPTETGYQFTWEGTYAYYECYVYKYGSEWTCHSSDLQSETTFTCELDGEGSYGWYVDAYDAYGNYVTDRWGYEFEVKNGLGDVDIVIYNRSDMTISDHELYVFYWTDNSGGGLKQLAYDSEKDYYTGTITISSDSTAGILIVNQDVDRYDWYGSEQTTDYIVEDNQVVLVVANPTEETEGKYLLREPNYTPTNLTVVSENGIADFSWEVEIPAPYYYFALYNEDSIRVYETYRDTTNAEVVTSINEDKNNFWTVSGYYGFWSEEASSEFFVFKGNNRYINEGTATEGEKGVYTFNWNSNLESFRLIIEDVYGRTVYDEYVNDTTMSYTFTESGTYYWTVYGYENGEYVAFSETWKVVVDLGSPEPEPTYYTLSISAGVGGQVSADKTNGTYVEGTVVTVTATPDAGYRFDKWSDGVTTATRTITLTSDTSLVATFTVIPPSELATYKLTLSCGEHGSITPAPGVHEYKEGDKVTLKATPDAGYVFNKWSDGVSAATRTIVISSDTTLEATFKKEVKPTTYYLDITAGNGGSVNEEVNGSYAYGTEVEIIATPAKGYRFDKWSDGDKHAKRMLTIEGEPITLEARFVKVYAITIEAGIGGTVNEDVNGTYDTGTEIEIQATATTGYQFVQWSDGEKEATRTLTLTNDITLTAEFQKVYTLEIKAGEGGSVNEEVNGTYAIDTELEIVATAAEGYLFKQWSDGDTNATRTISLTADTTLTAEFEAIQQEGIQDVESTSTAHKYLMNGRLYIRTANQTYSADGAVVQ